MNDTAMLHYKRVWLGGVEVREEIYVGNQIVDFYTTIQREGSTDSCNVKMGKESAIAAARAILRHFGEEL